MKINLEKIHSGKNESYISKRYNDVNFSSPRHYHEEFELILIENTSGKLFVGNNILPFKQGDLYLFAPQLVHCFKNKEKSGKTAKAHMLLFKKDFLGKEFLFRKETALLHQLLVKAENGIQFLNPSAKILSAFQIIVKREGLQGLIQMLSLLDMLSKHKRYKTLSKPFVKKYYYKLNEDKITIVFDYIEKNFQSQNVFASLSKITKMSSPSFSRYFKHKTGKTLTQHLNEVRISNAQKMLIETGENIQVIARKCGYAKQVYFNRIFKAINGISPKKFRQTFFTSS